MSRSNRIDNAVCFSVFRTVGPDSGRVPGSLDALQVDSKIRVEYIWRQRFRPAGTLTGTIPMLLSHFVVLAGGLTLITLTSGRLTLVMLSSLPVAIGMAMIFGRRTHRVAREAQDKLADTNVIVEETLRSCGCALPSPGPSSGTHRS